MKVTINNKLITLSQSDLLGEGGEAEVYDLPPPFQDQVVKLWKGPKHLSYEGNSEQARRDREAAEKRLIEYAEKVRMFPRGLPASVVSPISPAFTGRAVVGFTMAKVANAEKFKTLAQRAYRRSAGIDGNQLVETFRNLHRTVSGIHAARVVIGDFNYLNVLARGTEAFVLDADSFQFDRFLCRSFTTRFVDPLICDPNESSPVQHAPHTTDTDWYAYALMLFEVLLSVSPYGGVYDPKGAHARVSIDARPLKRISVFNPEVIYPVKGIHYSNLPDELLQFYHLLLEKDRRGPFPEKLLQEMRWTTCTKCNTEHARTSCPQCANPAPRATVVETVVGNVQVKRHAVYPGVLVNASAQDGQLRVIYWEDGAYKREDGSTVLTAPLNHDIKLRSLNHSTVASMNGTLAVLTSGEKPQTFPVDLFRGGRPVLDTNARHVYWVSEGRLLRNAEHGPKFLGPVLRNQTMIWAGPRFGVAFSRAQRYQSVYTFDAESTGVLEAKAFPFIEGNLIDLRCFFSDHAVWLLAASKRKGSVRHHAFVLNARAEILAEASADEDDGSWLGALSGKVALTLPAQPGGTSVHALLSTSSRGLVRVEVSAGKMEQTREFPDTRTVVPEDAHLLLTKQGLVAVSGNRADIVSFRR